MKYPIKESLQDDRETIYHSLKDTNSQQCLTELPVSKLSGEHNISVCQYVPNHLMQQDPQTSHGLTIDVRLLQMQSVKHASLQPQQIFAQKSIPMRDQPSGKGPMWVQTMVVSGY